MTPFKRNLSKLLFLTLVLILGTGISGLIYYLKMGHNEDTLNSLLFRELKQVEDTVRRSLEKIDKTTGYFLPKDWALLQLEQECKNALIGTDNSQVSKAHCLSKYKSAIEGSLKRLRESSDLQDIRLTSLSVQRKYNWHANTDGSFTFTLPRYDTAEILSQRYYPDQNLLLSITLKASVRHSLIQRVNRFQTVALVDVEGNVQSMVTHENLLRQNDYSSQFTNEAEIYIKKLRNLHPEPGSGTAIEGTGYVDIQSSDKAYRLYIHPIISDGLTTDTTHFYLTGLIEKSKITEQKLKLSPHLLMWLILGLLLLVAVIPLIKLRFVSSTYAIQPSDKSQIVLGILLAVGILTIGIQQQLFFGYVSDVKKEQLEHLYTDIKKDFDIEVRALLNTLENVIAENDYSKRCSTSFVSAQWQSDLLNVYSNAYVFKPSESLPFESFPKPAVLLDRNYYYNNILCEPLLVDTANKTESHSANTNFIETILFLDAKGNVDKQRPILLASEKFAAKRFIELRQREYVKQAVNKNFWRPFSNHIPFYMQRIFNIEDGHRNTLISFPSSLPDTNVAFAAASTRFESLADRPLPNHFGFAVINDKGDVIFHSDDNLSLIENFYTEANYNSELQVAKKHASVSEPVHMDILYKGDIHNIVVGAVSDAHQPTQNADRHSTIPWQLIVFYKPEVLQTNNMIMVFLAVLLFMLIIIPSFLLLRYLATQNFWSNIIYYCPHRGSYYIFLLSLIFGTCMFVQFQMGIVQTLTGRLLLWAISCLVLALFLIRWFSASMKAYHWLHRPVTSFVLIALVVWLLYRLIPQDPLYETLPVNTQFAHWGIVILILSIIATMWGVVRYCLDNVWQGNRPVQRRSNRQTGRFNASYVWFISALFYIAASIPASIISYSTHEYLLQRQARFEQDHITTTLNTKNQRYRQYLSSSISNKCDNFNPYSLPCAVAAQTTPPPASILTQTFPGALVAKFTQNRRECPPIWSEVISEQHQCLQWVFISSKKDETAQQDTRLPPPSDGHTDLQHKPDSFFDNLFSLMSSDVEFVSHLTYAAKTEDQHISVLQYRADLLMLNAILSGNGWLVVLLWMLFLPVTIYIVVRHMIVRRLLGENLADHYRVMDSNTTATNKPISFPALNVDDALQRGHSQLILNATRLSAENALKENKVALYKDKVHRITDCLGERYSGKQQGSIFTFIDGVDTALNAKDVPIVVAISGVDQVSLDADKRASALSLLYELHMDTRLVLVIIAETAPLYRLLNPASYETVAVSKEPDIDEKSAWSKLFSEFDKYYAWSPVHKSKVSNPFDPETLLIYECNGWPELTELEVRCRLTARDMIKKSYNGQCATKNTSLFAHWYPEQIIEFMLVHAGSLYRRKWEECTTREKLILWKVAHGASVNPASAQIIEHLVRRCYLYRDKGWHLVNESFRQFILTAENEQVINQWIDDSSNGAWSVLRIPIFALLLVLLVVFVYSSGSSLNTIISIATATLGIIPLLIKNMSLLKGGVSSDIE